MDNRKKILQVSLRLFYHKGYDAVSVQEIVKEAGITKPTLYYYFGSKYGLLEEVLQDGFSKFQQVLWPELEKEEGDFRNKLYSVTKVFLEHVIIENEFFFFLLSLMYSAKENDPYKAVKPHIHSLYQEMIKMFERAGSQLGNMNGRQEQFAIAYIGLLNQYAVTFLGKRKEPKKDLMEHVTDEEVRALVQQFMYGIMS